MKIILSFLLALIAIASPAYAINANYTAPEDGGTLNRNYHNGPITIGGFSTDRTVKLLLGGQNESPSTALGEFYWITNTGDATKKPTLTFKGFKAGITFVDTSTGQVSDSVTLKWGETVVIVQEVSYQTQAKFTKYNAGGGSVAIKPATATTIGGILSGPDILVDQSGKASISNSLRAPVVFSGVESGKDKVQIAMHPTGTGHQDAPYGNDVSSQYLMIGGTEYGHNSVRGIGFGYVGTNGSFAPAFIGYQETEPNDQTSGDLIFSTRPTSNAVVPTVRLRISSTGQITGEGGYLPTEAQSLVTKKYVDNAVGGILNYGSPGSLVINDENGTILTNFGYNQMFVLGVAVKTLNVQSISQYLHSNTIGEQIYIENQSEYAVKVTAQDEIKGQNFAGQSFNLYPEDVVVMKIDTATSWRMFFVSKQMNGSGTTGSEPTYLGTDRAGYRFFNVTTKKTSIWDGSGWVNSEGQSVTP